MITIGAFKVNKKKGKGNFNLEWDQYPLEDYPSPHPYFDTIGMVQHLVRKNFVECD